MRRASSTDGGLEGEGDGGNAQTASKLTADNRWRRVLADIKSGI